MMLKIFVFLSLICVCSCQVFGLGYCPSLTAKQDFVLEDYLGTWYEYEKYGNTFSLKGKCISATYGDNGDGTISVFNKQYDIFTGQESSISGSASFSGSTTEGKLVVTLEGVSNASPYWVLNTDYTEYAVVYSCSEFAYTTYQFAWILTRSRTPSTETVNRARNILSTHFLSPLRLKRTDQSNCPA